ncbi:phosphotransferase family protein [Falsibacillus albus]|uniref:Phosphotransferase family protein n=1 Tax=Falsibacillus albus TaxID=2478915 RepID=A0A3L7JYZ6_9BACI|nr:phosphotransferase family protein [Falsibacillus albus]RLQ96108.1 phosphotransferase family protein [Falsibacillus albus]
MPQQIKKDTIRVRPGEELDAGRLEGFLRSHLGEILPDGNLQVRQFSAGHSNLTYELKLDDWEAVLRRPPLGPVAPKAHDMEREYRILSEIESYFPPAPKPILFSKDQSIVGSPFFLMERKLGIVLDSEFPAQIEATKEEGRKLSTIMVERLVELHEIDYQITGLNEMTKPDGFMVRQVKGWNGRYLRAQTDDIKEADFLMAWLEKNIPDQQAATVIHYDFKLNNAMFNDDLTEMIGLFDWEMTTVGDPLADLGVAMSYWIQNDDPDLLKFGLGKPPVTIHPGFMNRREFIEEYGRRSGRDVGSMNFYLTFAYFKLAVICQQIYYRYKKGQTNDPRFSGFNQFVESLIKLGCSSAKE